MPDAAAGDPSVELPPSARRVLELLREADRPLKAYDLISRLDPRRPVSPPRVYRALKRLSDAGLIHRVLSLDAFVACRSPDRPHEPGFLLCERCGKSVEIDAGEAVRGQIPQREPRFTARRLVVEASGVCGACV